MWVLVVLEEDVDNVHVHGGPWATEEEGNEKAREFIKKADELVDTSSIRLTVTEIEQL